MSPGPDLRLTPCPGSAKSFAEGVSAHQQALRLSKEEAVAAADTEAQQAIADSVAGPSAVDLSRQHHEEELWPYRRLPAH